MRVPLEALPLPALSLSPSLRVLAANQLALETLGVSLRELARAPLARFFAPEAELARLISHAQQVPARSCAILVAGRPASVWLAPEQEARLLLFALDDAKAEIEELAQRREKAELIARLVMELAHEVRNPLAGLRAAAQWLSERLPDEPEMQEAAQIVLEQASRIEARIATLLALGPRDKLPQTRVNLHELIDEVSIGAPSHVRVFRNFDPGLPELVACRARLAQALENLWRNALEANPSWIEWRTSARPLAPMPGIGRPVVEVRITNDGAPVPPEVAARAFEPYVSGKRTGSGLGLAIVEQVMREHGGRARLIAEPGRTSVVLHLPLRTEVKSCAS